MRYRDVCQAVSSCCSALGDEGPAMFGDGIDSEQQFVHAGEQSDLGQLAARSKPLVMSAQPRVEAHRGQRGIHNAARKRALPTGVRRAWRVLAYRIARVLERCRRKRQRGGVSEVGGIAEFGDQAGCGLRADAVDGGEQAANLVLAQFAFDVAVDIAQAVAQHVEVIAGIANLQAVGRAVMLANRAARCIDEGASEIGPTWCRPS